jgi:hypothetical protein
MVRPILEISKVETDFVVPEDGTSLADGNLSKHRFVDAFRDFAYDLDIVDSSL